MISAGLDQEICRVLIGWDNFEKKNGGSAVIDFNLPGLPAAMGKSYETRQEILGDLQRLSKNPDIQNNIPLSQKIAAQEAYLRNLMGENWDFPRYIKATMGFTSVPFSEEQMQSQRTDLVAKLKPFGISFDADLVQNLRQADKIIPADEAEDFYRGILARNLATLSTQIGEIPAFNFHVETVEADAYWKNWVDGRRADYLLRFNRKTLPVHYHASATILAFHEILAHMVQAAIQYNKIETGRLPACMGLTTVHGPEQFQSEGLAQTLVYFLDSPDLSSPLIAASQELTIYKAMADANINFMINTGSTAGDCIEYGAVHMPFSKPEEIVHGLRSKTKNPQFRCYEYVYGPAAHFFKEFAKQASAGQKQNLLNIVYNDWLGAEELSLAASRILSRSPPEPKRGQRPDRRPSL